MIIYIFSQNQQRILLLGIHQTSIAVHLLIKSSSYLLTFEIMKLLLTALAAVVTSVIAAPLAEMPGSVSVRREVQAVSGPP